MDADKKRAGLACLVYAAATFAWYCAWKHFLAEQSADPAIFENCFWNALHGHGLRSWLEGSFPHLAVHFSPGILLLLPLYALFPSMHVVHAVVCLGVAAAGYALYLEARERLDPRTSAFVLFGFLLHPTVVLQTFMEFHEQALAFLPLVLVVRFVRLRAAIPALLSALLLVSLREDNALFLLALAGLALFRKETRALALGLGALAIAWLGIYKVVGVGMIGQGRVPNVFASSYGIWGDTPAAALRAMLADPVRVVRHLVSRPTIAYLAQLLGPVLGVLPFGSILALAAVPQTLLVLLADPAMRIQQVRLHYSVAPATIAYLATVSTLGWIALRRPRVARVLAILMVVISVATLPVWARRAVSRLHPHREQALAAARSVPDTASVAAPGFLLNVMARRRQLDFVWGTHADPVEYVILQETRARWFTGESIEPVWTEARADSLEGLGFSPTYERDGYHVYGRK